MKLKKGAACCKTNHVICSVSFHFILKKIDEKKDTAVATELCSYYFKKDDLNKKAFHWRIRESYDSRW